MDKNIINLLARQMQDIMLNKSLDISDKLEDASEELKNLQNIIYSLSSSLAESNRFLKELSEGNLDAELPDRYNFSSGYLKELHSIMKHLVWQAAQIASGDYTQKVNFMGNFSDSFNIMTKQLEEREIKLKAKSNALAQSRELLISIMETQSNFIVVLDVETKEIIYSNKSANENIYALLIKDQHNNDCCILEEIKYITNITAKYEREYYCNDERYIKVMSYPIEWKCKKAIVHYISDITAEKESNNNLSNMAYTDELTGAYNRRYCKEAVSELLNNKSAFSFVLLDIDELKSVNDKFGHVTGDEYILKVTKTVKNNIRNNDIFCRIGGDEFVIVFKNCSEKTAENKMKKIHNKILQIKKDYFLSISYGIVYVSNETSLSPDEILELSDAKMYEFKNKYKR